MGEPRPESASSSSSQRLLWRLWVAPERGRPVSPRRAAISTWGNGRPRRVRQRVRVVEG